MNETQLRLNRPCPFGQWVSVESSNLKEVRYDDTLGQLTVRFNGVAQGGTGEYIYMTVPRFRYRNLVRAKSVGKYFNQYVRYAYPTYKGLA